MRHFHLLPLILLAGCGDTGSSTNQFAAEENNGSIQNQASVNALPGNDMETPLNPPAPGEPGGLPDDKTPVSEAPFTETSAQGAANVVQIYYALLEAKKYEPAWKVWQDEGRASGMTFDEFKESFSKYREYHANIGAPGRIEGAAGSLYVEVPVQVYGRLNTGDEFNMLGSVQLRRVNDVPGSTAEQRKWHIAASNVKPRPH